MASRKQAQGKGNSGADLVAVVARLEATVAQLEATVGRFCVVMERQLSASDQVSARARKALQDLHPDKDMDAIRARIRKQLADAKR